MKKIQFSCIIDGVSKKKDGTLSIKLGTQELPPQDTAEIFEMGNKQIWAVFCETGLKDSDLEIPEVTDELDTKSPSQRLRNVIYRIWEQAGKEKKTNKVFEHFYRDYMEKLLENLKEKLI